MSLKDDFRQELERIREDMKSLGGSIKGKAQRATGGVKAAWAEVEPKIAKFEDEASVATDRVVADLKKSGGELLAQLRTIKDNLLHPDGQAGEADAGEADAGEADAKADATETAKEEE